MRQVRISCASVIALVFLCFLIVRAQAGDLAEYLTPAELEKIEVILALDGKADRETAERNYQSLVQRQTFSDLLKLYDPKNAELVQITYAGFTPDWVEVGHGETTRPAKPAKDLGYGLHVVKRLVLPLPGGREKVIDVNEQWSPDRRTGGLFLPDEIRVKTLVQDGERRVPGSSALYLFDSFRIAWGPNASGGPYVGGEQISLHRRTRYHYDAQAKKNRIHQMRVRVSAPFSCQNCHRHGSDGLAEDFLAPGEARNHEAIVQDSHFTMPLEKTRGFTQYMSYLSEKRPRDPAFREAVKQALLNPRKSMAVPHLYEAIGENLRHHAFSWLGVDGTLYGQPVSQMWYRQGVYAVGSGILLIDAIEEVIEGKYRWWDPEIVVPRGLRSSPR